VRHAIRSPVLEEVLVQYVVVDDAVQFVRARRVMMGSRIQNSAGVFIMSSDATRCVAWLKLVEV
jgi:hypothetical protein